MSIPSTAVVQHALMSLIAAQPEYSIKLHRGVAQLEPRFPELSHHEKSVPFHTSRSHFANRVQTAVARLKDEGWLEWRSVSGTGIWRFTPKAVGHWRDAFLDADRLVAEMMNGER